MNEHRENQGMFICFEGGDAAGKSTLAQFLVDELRGRGLSAVLVDKKSAQGFSDACLETRMSDLRRVLWDYPPDAPLWEWGDHHWFHLIVSWFSVLDRCKVKPLLRNDNLVILDNWYYKFAARFSLKADFGRGFVQSCFSHLSVPDRVLLVDVDPRVAVLRRSEFSATESGRMDGHARGGAEDFVSYQEKVLRELHQFSDSTWVRLEASHATMDALVNKAANEIATMWASRR